MMDWLINMQASHWFAFGLILLALEVGAGIAYLLGPGLAAMVVAGIHWVYPLSPLAQMFAFVIASIVATFAYARYFRNRNDAAADGLHDRLRGMIGKETQLDKTVDGMDRIAFGDTLWRVRSNTTIDSGQKVRVTEVEGDVLIIEAVL